MLASLFHILVKYTFVALTEWIQMTVTNSVLFYLTCTLSNQINNVQIFIRLLQKSLLNSAVLLSFRGKKNIFGCSLEVMLILASFCKVTVVCLETSVNWTLGFYQAASQIKYCNPTTLSAVCTSHFPVSTLN